MADPADMVGGDPEENAEITRGVLNGDKGPKRDVVLLNSSAALVAADMAKDFNEGLKVAENSIDSGKAKLKLEELVKFTRENG